jgi:GDPmannose 4,6-dehydratase
LLAKGYLVHGIIRRASTFNTDRIDHIYQDPHEPDVRLHLHYGDMTDGSQIARLIRTVEPDEIYNLAAQSHVAVSFQQPEYTGDVDGLGTIRLLEAIRESGVDTRLYQAGTSEMFGAAPPPQNEDTRFEPRSPYAAAKIYAYHMVRNYREAYDMFAVTGILFNHECVPAGTPVVVRRHGLIDICPIDDVVPHRTDPRSGHRYTSEGGDFEVWDGEQFVACTARSANWRSDSELVTVHGRGGIVEATPDHVVFLDAGERELPAGEVAAGDAVWLADQPETAFGTVLTPEEAWLLGLLVADGSVAANGAGHIVNGDESILAEAADRWQQVSGGHSVKTQGSPSAFSDAHTTSLVLNGNRAYLRMLRAQIYTREGDKRVPMRVLNASPEVQEAFLRGYNLGDGLKAGNGIDEFKSFRTTSAVLAAGLIWLAQTGLGRRVCVYRQGGSLGGGDSYQINLSSGGDHGNKGAHLRKPLDEVRKVTRRRYTGWVFDLATTSNRFAAGPGLVVVHNSPRRGETFVTRKITRAIARIVAGLDDAVYLGNLDAVRDWGHAKDYVKAMWQMLQQDSPRDYVIGTGETHTVREFAAAAFGKVGLDWQAFTRVDPAYYRPTEVEHLHADPSRAIQELGWRTEHSFDELVEEMVGHDLTLVGLDSIDEARARVAERFDGDQRL